MFFGPIIDSDYCICPPPYINCRISYLVDYIYIHIAAAAGHHKQHAPTCSTAAVPALLARNRDDTGTDTAMYWPGKESYMSHLQKACVPH